ncbi:MAG TPA: TonB-dependent receptor [Gammaproteobacteria bacterium]|jgi:iron complex outermembrane receptor protein
MFVFKKKNNSGTAGKLPLLVLGMLLIGATFPAAHAQQQYSMRDFLSLSIEELAKIKISSVSKREESLSNAPASIYVITQDVIRNSGATSIPEALRLAPNLQVARINGAQYAISARGFNALVSNKLLVLIDGRTVYTPLFSGVFWNQQDILLEDVERIEVISGPGGTLWGTNAVNGVINIITKNAAETQGMLISAYGGNFERGASLRYGGGFGETGHYRVYAKGMQIDHTLREDGSRVFDAFERAQAGFRLDWGDKNDRFTFQGDVYDGHTEDRFAGGITFDPIEVSGANLLARWKRRLDGGSDFQLQAYWDRIDRSDVVLFQPEADIFDIEFQHAIPFDSHRILWGGGYRRGEDDVEPGFFSTFVPGSRELSWENLFIQDELRFTDNLEATFGIRLESNDYTGTEHLPSLRLAWKLSGDRLLWTSLSRAIRAPSRFDKDVFFPAPPNSLVIGGPNFQSEVAEVLELGYRAQPSETLSYSITAFYHDWDKLRSGTAIPVELENKIEGPVYGIEAWADYQVTQGWRLSLGGTRLEKELRLEPDSTDPVGIENDTLANDPDYWAIVRSALDLPGASRLDISIRHVASLPNPEVPAYTVANANYSWRVRDNLELSVAVQNLADRGHREFENPQNGSEFGRRAFVKLVWVN